MKQLLEELKKNYGLDHDLLISIHGLVDRATTDINQMKESLSGRPTREEWQEMKVSVAWLQRIAYGGLGIVAFVELYTRIVVSK